MIPLHSKSLLRFTLFVWIGSLFSISPSHGQTNDWIASGSHPQEYEMDGDPTVLHLCSDNLGFIKSIESSASGYGRWMTSAPARLIPNKYAGKQIILSAFVKTLDVSDSARLFITLMGPTGDPILEDNMEDHPIQGTTAWEHYQIIVNVPVDCTGIKYGLSLSGTGQAWIDGLKLEIIEEAPSEAEIQEIKLEAYYYYSFYQDKQVIEIFQPILEDSENIYDHLIYFLALYRDGQIEKAQDYITHYSNTLLDEDWPAPLVFFYSGIFHEDEVLSLTGRNEQKKCEAYYYLGMAYLLEMDLDLDPAISNRAQAMEYFEKCVATNIDLFYEYAWAGVEMESTITCVADFEIY